MSARAQDLELRTLDPLAQCAACIDQNCNAEQTACQANTRCQCYEDCLSKNGGDMQACGATCNGPPNPQTNAVLQCTQQNCASDCGGGAGGAGGGTGGAGGGVGGGPIATCITCLQANCNAQYQACLTDTNCQCWRDCLEANGGAFQACFGQCGAPGQATQALAPCVQSTCSADCMGGGTGGAGGGTGGAGGGTGGAAGSAGGSPTPACDTCLTASCATEYAACKASTRCSCFLNCAAANPSTAGQQQCVTQCNAQNSQSLNNLVPCSNQNCANECP